MPSHEMPSFSIPPIGERNDKDSKKDKKEGSRAKEAATAALLAALAQAPEALAQQDVENAFEGTPIASQKENTKDSPLLEFETGKATSHKTYRGGEAPRETDQQLEMRLTKEAKARREASFRLPVEAKFAAQQASVREALRIDEVLEKGREKLTVALQTITAETGANTQMVVNTLGGVVINQIIKNLNGSFSGKVDQAIIGGIPENDARTLAFVHSRHNAENMPGRVEITKMLGIENAKWQLTAGVNPNMKISRKKIGADFEGGVTFRMVFP